MLSSFRSVPPPSERSRPRAPGGSPSRSLSLPRLFAGLLVVLAVLLAGCSPTATTGNGTTGTRTGASSGSVATPGWAKGMATVPASRLPAEARRTLALIDRGGPYPYSRDGIVFGNFERHLPKHQRGYYHEYTVRTPGSRDRGARRIITGQGGEFYYTDDHYNSFRAVLR
ncbi:guanine-specific ribonuclease N1 and T1 [Streptomyces griseofuscus]|uniref:Guanine-specific ribonuclease N1 and T1 n=1 Tax=Streptomyces griseofuscus TaxID=146922 RepID=A0A426S6H2_9ACTN|nr:ribonuclease domain-containing protein [Streptomyces griseofuscus]RRQ78878.1 guanine-specific ribonuclease N1 and T1 [Streptomyces griseofuscus]RRQ85533.1 guanine-specific ribonuclease N1 and T1 [Streptomyces griseofuscus]